MRDIQSWKKAILNIYNAKLLSTHGCFMLPKKEDMYQNTHYTLLYPCYGAHFLNVYLYLISEQAPGECGEVPQTQTAVL